MNLIFHHTDMDGYSSAAVVEHFVNNCYCRPVNYNNYLPTLEEIHKTGKEFDTIYIVDYSFTNDTLYLLQELLEEYNVVWIDHHKSSLGVLDQLQYDNLSYCVNIDYCGAINTWEYFTTEPIPYCLQLVDSWDTWKHFDENDFCFKLFFDTKKARQSIDIFKDLLNKSSEEAYEQIQSYLDECKILENYILNEYNLILKRTYTVEFNGYNCIVANCNIKSSMVFGNEIANYDFGIVWFYNGDTYNYSIYTAYEDLDASQIAELYGGGGHKAAAGFITTERVV